MVLNNFSVMATHWSISSSCFSQYCWRWTGFSFGFDLLVTYTNRFIIFKRNTLSQPCNGAVSLLPRRNIAFRWGFDLTARSYSGHLAGMVEFLHKLISQSVTMGNISHALFTSTAKYLNQSEMKSPGVAGGSDERSLCHSSLQIAQYDLKIK